MIQPWFQRMADSTPTRYHFDFLILGSGLAGLTAALKAAEHGKVAIITKKLAGACNTAKAQGGIAAVLDDDDSIESHVADTLTAGCGLSNESVVRKIVEAGPARMADLMDWGVAFTKRDEVDNIGKDELHLGKEGGHSQRRVAHCGDITGKALSETLLARVDAHPQITLFEDAQAVDLIATRRLGWYGPNRCLGAYIYDCKRAVVHTFLARFTILATGGAGKAYLYTSNPDVACGEGVAMAYRAYAEVANMEFYQFHPTCLFHPHAGSFLISEALRGEGAILKAQRGGKLEPFLEDQHELGSLAPRDIVARAIDRELKRSGRPCVYLDISHHDKGYLRRRFPTIYETCLQFDIDMAKQPVPVVPAAHYCCGGVRTDIDGTTCVGQLYAAGEVAHTGLHGANRLASNSLLEAMAIAHNAVEHAVSHFHDVDASHLNAGGARKIPDWTRGNAIDPDELIVIYHNWDEIRRFMWDYVGIFRTTKRLQRAKARIRNIRKEIEHFYWDFVIAADLVELRNMASVAEMIIDCALQRHASIGLHYNADFPVVDASQTSPETILRRPGFEKTLH